MESELSTERGSAGIDMILLSFMLLVFIAAPLLMSVFEVYNYVLQGVAWSARAENVLDQVEWQFQTESLSECERNLLLEETRKAFEGQFGGVSGTGRDAVWTIPALSYNEGNPPKLSVSIHINYEPVTMVGLFISQGGPLFLDLYREREFPIDR